MDKKDKNTTFSGANWKDYSEFEFSWMELVLTKNILKREDLLFLLNKFGIKFLEKNWEESVSMEEMGNALINDVPKEKLWPEVVDVLNQRYPDKLNFEEAFEIWGKLGSYNASALLGIYKKIFTNKNIADFVSDEKNFENEDVLSEFLKSFIMEEFYKMPKKEVIESLEK